MYFPFNMKTVSLYLHTDIFSFKRLLSNGFSSLAHLQRQTRLHALALVWHSCVDASESVEKVITCCGDGVSIAGRSHWFIGDEVFARAPFTSKGMPQLVTLARAPPDWLAGRTVRGEQKQRMRSK